MAKVTNIEPRKAETRPIATEVNAKSGAKVIVACKLPNGLELHLDKEIEEYEQSPSGPRLIKIWRRDPEAPVVRVHGNRPQWGKQLPCELAGGYALTPGVDKDFWEAWLKQNHKQDYVVNRLIFAMPSIDAAKGEAREHKTVLSGFEPLNPERRHVPGTDRTEPVDPRWPRQQATTIGSVSEVQDGDRDAA